MTQPEKDTETRACGPILIVEDDEDTRETLRYLLEAEGHTVAGAIHGKDALAWLAEGGRPCLILLDLMMPVMTGFELLAALRADPKHAGTPVVLVSAWPDKAREATGIQGFLTKPFDFSELLDYARRYC
ncbi:MAG TPA: response regulator [Kofleriaceae bacterium]|nr:response regulator [Kofleriaceae bacterium]